ncbi:universal stress protein [uncultured Roseobacter sp.]|uniref:universal stress protein n=1 Tax=uncultured Roseobacter sp. TaxID=114847 RepID=UPI00261E4097|nr:universal stress protein [uncultured Roseobacter sp.]
MLSKILVPVRGDGLVETVLGHAAALARRHHAHVVVAHCRTRAEDLMPYGVPLPAFARKTMLTQAQELADQQERELREELHSLAEKLQLNETPASPENKTTVEFVEESGRMADVIKHNGRLADLIVVAKPDRDRNVGTNSLKSGLFQTGRPVLMCPTGKHVPDAFGERIAVAWNGSLEASRTVALTLDLVGAAGSVVILAGGKGEPHGATAEELVDYYKLRGISAEIHRFEAESPGAALLRKAHETKAGLLVMGAYSTSHERETLLGGNTQAVVDAADIPVVLAH